MVTGKWFTAKKDWILRDQRQYQLHVFIDCKCLPLIKIYD